MIVIDDYGSEDWESLLAPYRDKIDIRYFRLEHDMGWRGCTLPFNFAFSKARGEILMESNPHLMLPPHAVRTLYVAHKTDFARNIEDKLWVTLRGYTISRDNNEFFDTVDWHGDIHTLKNLPGFNNPWTTMWEDETHFYGSHLICSIPRKLWFDEVAVTEHREIVNEYPGFPEGHCYGIGDPWYAGQRKELGITSVNISIHHCPFYHQDHYGSQEVAQKFNIKSLLNDQGQTKTTAPWWGQKWVPVQPDGMWPAPPVPWESYVEGEGELPKLREEFAHYYDMDWAKENAPWIARELEVRDERKQA